MSDALCIMCLVGLALLILFFGSMAVDNSIAIEKLWDKLNDIEKTPNEAATSVERMENDLY